MKRRLLLINPVNPARSGLTINRSSRFPLIGLGLAAALTPESWEVGLADENWEPFTYHEADLVGITTLTASARRSYEIAAAQRGAPYYWFCVIICVPFGSLVYFFMVKAPELGLGTGATRYRPVRIRQQRADLPQLRYQFEQNPCLANQALLASGLYDAGQYDEATGHYCKVLRRDERYQSALYGLSLCHIARGEHAAAVEALRRLVEENRSYADYQGWLRLADCLAAAGEHEQALEALEGLVKACPRLNHIVALANVLIEANRPDEARAHLEQALLDYEHSPRHVQRQFGNAACQATRILGQLA